MSNALAAMGIARSQDECAALCKTTGTEGTPPKRLLAAIRVVGREPIRIQEKRAEVAILFLSHWLTQGRSAILCVDNDTHWVAAIGLLGDRTLVADPADNELVITLSRQQLADRWGGDGSCYGVVL
jgi:hypothetical protein